MSQATEQLEAALAATARHKERTAEVSAELAKCKAEQTIMLTDLEVLRERLTTESQRVQQVGRVG